MIARILSLLSSLPTPVRSSSLEECYRAQFCRVMGESTQGCTSSVPFCPLLAVFLPPVRPLVPHKPEGGDGGQARLYLSVESVYMHI